MLDPYTYRCPAGHPDPCPVCTGAPHLEEILQYEGAHTVAAVIVETVTGTNGIIVPPDGYLQSIREVRSEEHTSELQSQSNLVCRLLLEKKQHECRRALHG